MPRKSDNPQQLASLLMFSTFAADKTAMERSASAKHDLSSTLVGVLKNERRTGHERAHSANLHDPRQATGQRKGRRGSGSPYMQPPCHPLGYEPKRHVGHRLGEGPSRPLRDLDLGGRSDSAQVPGRGHLQRQARDVAVDPRQVKAGAGHVTTATTKTTPTAQLRRRQLTWVPYAPVYHTSPPAGFPRQLRRQSSGGHAASVTRRPQPLQSPLPPKSPGIERRETSDFFLAGSQRYLPSKDVHIHLAGTLRTSRCLQQRRQKKVTFGGATVVL